MYDLLTVMQQHKTNAIIIAGEVVSEFRLHHIQQGVRYYVGAVTSMRYSDIPDTFLVLVPEGMLDFSRPHLYKRIILCGGIQVFKNRNSRNTRTSYYILASHAEFNEFDGPTYVNTMYLDGTVRFKPVYRKTPKGREITNITLSTVDESGCYHDVPCIFWGKNARLTADLAAGTHLHVWARFESRQYEKKLPDGKAITRTTYEASICHFSLIWEPSIKECMLP